MNFNIAMHNALRTAAYETPARTAAPVFEYLIVQRPDAETITISDAGRAPADKPAKAPDTLSANNTQVGTLIRRDAEAGTETFILNRFLPRGVVLPRSEAFFPADGFVVLSTKDGRPFVSVSGRHAHAREIAGGRFVAIDFPGEPTSSASAFTWHFEASYLPWVNETSEV
ncbi:hypothetical protein L0664_00290 [Octadecabacter sp. G9-8]|uniref:Hedgehog/Intein (Hint) domain-containing protein n=1 Tax=Octadecabacter dasysiphoniae TaxID=2909341 RepID=A0ABS9CQN6_9RHOB|nr:hypothetical protein [Octadecabacter dasysiphoniae]MCF2869488.1 hypothetical protein [Octadecabacter dasysiphoniae]